MKNIFKMFGVIALVAIIGFSMTACDDGTKDIPVTGVTLNKTSLSLTVGGTETLTATVSPSDATNKAVGWSSSNSGVATVTNGTVTAVTAGSTTITVTTADGGKTAQCTVTVTGSTTPTTPTTNSLDGIWEISGGGMKISVSGSTGIVNAFGNVNALGQSAIDKGYLTLNSTDWRNLTSTGNLTWSGEMRLITYNTSNPNVATGTRWSDTRTFTMSADGQTLTLTNNGTLIYTFTRKQ